MNQHTNLCYNCGGTYLRQGGEWVCANCGSYRQAESSGEELTLLYAAYQKLRLADFFEAEQEFDDIIRKHPKIAQAYWGRLMSRYGIKYEEDYDGRRIPTCYSASIESILNASDYLKALEYASEKNREFYKQQAEYIEKVRHEWVKKASQEKPYDIFICFKDSDMEKGLTHTADSDELKELYMFLMEKGYRVFFSRESLRSKGGEKYEPYIFNALSTAKVMLVYGSNPDYINATWVKNEWTRYQKRIASGEKHPNSLIVAYKGFSPKELPLALSATGRQHLDAGKASFYSDLLDAITPLLSADIPVKSAAPAKPAAPKSAPAKKTTAPKKKTPAKKKKKKTARKAFSVSMPSISLGGIGKILKHPLIYCLLALVAIVVSRFLPPTHDLPQFFMGFGIAVLFALLTIIVNRKEDETWALWCTIFFSVVPLVPVILILCGIHTYTLFTIVLLSAVACLGATFFFMVKDYTHTEVSMTFCILSLSLCTLEVIIMSALTAPSVAAQVIIGICLSVWAIWTAAAVMLDYADEYYLASWITVCCLLPVLIILTVTGLTTLVFILSILFAAVSAVLLYYAVSKSYYEAFHAWGIVDFWASAVLAGICALLLLSPAATQVFIGIFFAAYIAFAVIWSIKSRESDAYLIYFVMNIVSLGVFAVLAFFVHVALILCTAGITIACNLVTQKIMTVQNNDDSLHNVLNIISVVGHLVLCALVLAIG